MARDEDGSQLIDLLRDENQETPDNQLIESSRQEGVQRILDLLEERERDVLKLYFGLGVETTHTLDEIGSQQIKEKAIHRLKNSYLRKQLKAVADF